MYISNFIKFNCDIVGSEEVEGEYSIKMPINLRTSSSISAFVCGPGTISFEWEQPCSIADLTFYEEGSNEPPKFCPKSDKPTPFGPYPISPGRHKIVWEYKFRERAGIGIDNPVLTSIGWIKDIHMKGVKFCDGPIDSEKKHKPSLPYVEGSKASTVGSLCNYSAISVDTSGGVIRYIFDWGDGLRNVTEAFSSAIEANMSHTWMMPGSYKLGVIAINGDNYRSDTSYENIEISPRNEYIHYPATDFDKKLNHSNYTIFYLEDGHYDKSMYIGENANNIAICSFPRSYAVSPIDESLNMGPAFDSLNGDFCIHLHNTSNIAIEGINFYNGNYSLIIENCKNIKVIGNRFFSFKKAGILLVNSSAIIIKNNVIRSDNINCKGIIFANSNSTSLNPTIVRDNSYELSDSGRCVSLAKSCGNALYMDNNITVFKEDELECGLIGDGIYNCANDETLELKKINNYNKMKFCNSLIPNYGEEKTSESSH